MSHLINHKRNLLSNTLIFNFNFFNKSLSYHNLRKNKSHLLIGDFILNFGRFEKAV